MASSKKTNEQIAEDIINTKIQTRYIFANFIDREKRVVFSTEYEYSTVMPNEVRPKCADLRTDNGKEQAIKWLLTSFAAGWEYGP